MLRRPSRALAVLASSTLLVIGVAGCSSDGAEKEPKPSASSGETTEADEADVLGVEVGDCIAQDQLSGNVESLPLVPCEEAHDSEVYFVVGLTAEEYPGEEAVATIREEQCRAQFKDFIGLSYDESVLEITALEPSRKTWDEGDRAVVCVVADPAGGVTGSLEDAAR